MKPKYNILLFLSLLILVISGCAQPDEVTLQKNSANADGVESSAQGDGAVTNGDKTQTTESKISTIDDNNRQINETYGTGDYAFKIDATVYVPEADAQAGTLIPKDIDISLVEQYLCGGEKLHLSDESEGAKYVSDGNEVNNGLSYDISFENIGNGDALFQNFKLDAAFSGELSGIIPGEQTAEQKDFVTNMEQHTQTLFQNLDLDAKVSHTRLVSSVNNDFCFVSVDSCVDRFRLVRKEYGAFGQNNINISDVGVGQVNFGSIYTIQNAEPVNIVPLDEILEIVKEVFEIKNINGHSETISSVELAYMVESTENGSMQFYPIWCFSGQFGPTSGDIPFLCINAQNGNIEYMS